MHRRKIQGIRSVCLFPFHAMDLQGCSRCDGDRDNSGARVLEQYDDGSNTC